jgi:hypothetical protein
MMMLVRWLCVYVCVRVRACACGGAYVGVPLTSLFGFPRRTPLCCFLGGVGAAATRRDDVMMSSVACPPTGSPEDSLARALTPPARPYLTVSSHPTNHDVSHAVCLRDALRPPHLFLLAWY